MNIFATKRPDNIRDYISESFMTIFSMLPDFLCVYDKYIDTLFTNYNFKCKFRNSHDRGDLNTIYFIKYDGPMDEYGNIEPFLIWKYDYSISPIRIRFYRKYKYNKSCDIIGSDKIIANFKNNSCNDKMTIDMELPMEIDDKWGLVKGIHPSVYISYLKNQPDNIINEFFNNHVNI